MKKPDFMRVCGYLTWKKSGCGLEFGSMGVCLSDGRQEEAACWFDLCIAADGAGCGAVCFSSTREGRNSPFPTLVLEMGCCVMGVLHCT